MVLLNELRAAQGLGEKRWKSLLKRNAAMRLLVQDDVKVTPDAIEAVIDAQHGARRQCRVMALPTLDSCAKARMRLDAGEPFGEVAADMSTPVAIAYTELDWKKTPYDDAPTLALKTPRGQDVQALILLSPETTAPGLSVSKSVDFIRVIGRPVLICVGTKSKSDLTTANKMHDQLAPKKEEKEQIIYIERYESPLGGTNLLYKNLGVEKHMFVFLTKHLKDHKSDWRDRRSKLDL